MARFFVAAAAAVLLLTAATVTFGLAPERNQVLTRSLREAVMAFNRKAAEDPVGKDQPPLTEDEVVAAIRGWIRERTPKVSDVTYAAFQKVAETGQLPEGAGLRFITGWRNYRGYDFDVWWVDLSVAGAANDAYTLRIRDQKFRSRPTGQPRK